MQSFHRNGIMPFMKEYLSHLNIFKGGFTGNEFNELDLPALIKKYLGPRKGLRVLDIGSADGKRLGRVLRQIEPMCDFRESYCLDPISDNKELDDFSRQKGLHYLTTTLEDAHLPENHFDLVFMTHCAYYFYSPALAHRVLLKSLKKDALVIVILISKSCVLNKITEMLLEPLGVDSITAESYPGLSALKEYHVEEMIPCSVDKGINLILNVDYFVTSDERLKSLAYILLRNKGSENYIDNKLNDLKKMLLGIKNSGTFDRINYITLLRPQKLLSTKSTKGVAGTGAASGDGSDLY